MSIGGQVSRCLGGGLDKGRTTVKAVKVSVAAGTLVVAHVMAKNIGKGKFGTEAGQQLGAVVVLEGGRSFWSLSILTAQN